MSFSKLSPGGGAYKAKLRSFRATMESIAGSETESLLLAYFKSRHGKNILPKLKDELWAPQLSDLIDKIKNCYKSKGIVNPHLGIFQIYCFFKRFFSYSDHSASYFGLHQ